MVIVGVEAEKVNDVCFDPKCKEVIWGVEDLFIWYVDIVCMGPAITTMEVMYVKADEVVGIHGHDRLLGVLEMDACCGGETWCFQIGCRGMSDVWKIEYVAWCGVTYIGIEESEPEEVAEEIEGGKIESNGCVDVGKGLEAGVDEVTIDSVVVVEDGTNMFDEVFATECILISGGDRERQEEDL